MRSCVEKLLSPSSNKFDFGAARPRRVVIEGGEPRYDLSISGSTNTPRRRRLEPPGSAAEEEGCDGESCRLPMGASRTGMVAVGMAEPHAEERLK
jgi:hypothetical protein